MYKIWLLFFLLFLSSGYASRSPKLTVTLDWFANPNHAPIYLAQRQGLFKKYHLDVEIIVPADPTDPPKWVAMGKSDIALDYQPHVIMEANRGLPIRQIGTLIDHPLNCLVVLASSNINKLSDLKGKTIAYSSPAIDLALLKTMMKHVSVDIDEIEPINVHYDLTQALLTGKVSAAIGMMRNFELIQLKLLGRPVHAFYPENYGVPAYSELVFIGKLNSKKELYYADFFKALDEARRYILDHPEESLQQFVMERPELNNQLNRIVWFDTLPHFAKAFGKVDQIQYEQLRTFLP